MNKRQIHLTMSEDVHKCITEKALAWHRESDNVPEEIKNLLRTDNLSIARIRTAFVLSSATKSQEQKLVGIIDENKSKILELETNLKSTKENGVRLIERKHELSQLYKSEKKKSKSYRLQINLALECLKKVPYPIKRLLGIHTIEEEIEQFLE